MRLRSTLPTLYGILYSLLMGLTVLGQSTNSILEHRLIAIGNTVDIALPETYYQQLDAYLQQETTPFTLLVNGDLVDHEITSQTFFQDSSSILQLIRIVAGHPTAKLVVLQGDRDWNFSQAGGWKNSRELEDLIQSFRYENVYWIGKNGCPGPEDVQLSEHLLLIGINTQWWNHTAERPEPIDAVCKTSNEDDFFEQVEDLISEAGNQNIVLAGHFPLYSLGEYGGKFPLKKHLLPLPVLGGFITAYHQNIGTSVDIANEHFDAFRERLTKTIDYEGQLIYLSGHEKNLQILDVEGDYFINSGAPQKGRFAGKSHEALYAASQSGFIELLYYNDGSVGAQVIGYQAEKGFYPLQLFSLFSSSCEETSVQNVPENENFIPCLEEELPGTALSAEHPEAITKVAGSEYAAGAFKSFFLGKHYRVTWTQPVKAPFLNLDTTYQGLSPYKVGGGRQTSSLRFKGGDGNDYTFRSVDKDPIKALDPELRGTFIARGFKDQTTTQHPYGAIGVDQMLNALGVLHAHPRLYVMPEDTQLGPFRQEFGGMLGMLEEVPKTRKDGAKSFGQSDKVIKSYALFHELYEDHDHQVAQPDFALARAFDIFVGDWSKHADNWKWAMYEQGEKEVYVPIPRDRDHVFSRWDGVLPWLADREWAFPYWENFDYDIKDIRSLTFQPRHLDRLLTNRLTRQDWLHAASYLQQQLTDEVIRESISTMPAETYALSGEEIEKKLISRRGHMQENILRYYRLLSREIDVVGSDKEETFTITRNTDGSVAVDMFDEKKSGENELLYHRIFYPEETREIRVFGIGNDDTFIIRGNTEQSIPVRIIGGENRDNVYDSSYVKGSRKYTLIYEKSDKADIYLGKEGKRVRAKNESSYDYDRTAYHYNTYLPLIYPGYNSNDGFSLAIGVNFKRYQYDKYPFSSEHALYASYTSENFFRAGYAGRFQQVLGPWHLLLNATYASPDADYIFFYGLGNETEKNEQLYDQDFYRTRFNTLLFSAGFGRDFWKKSNFTAQLQYENDDVRIDPNTILSEIRENIFGVDVLHIAGLQLALDLDFRDNASLPQKGTRLKVQHNNGIITNYDTENFGITDAFMEWYGTAWWKRPLTLGLRAGGTDTYGDIPFFKLPSLGQREALRGYFRNRFTGDSRVYLNTELRLELGTVATGFLPFTFGAKGFYDVGRVYYSEETSDKWHAGYGGGFYVFPLRESFTFNFSLGFSEEETALFMLSIGTTFR